MNNSLKIVFFLLLLSCHEKPGKKTTSISINEEQLTKKIASLDSTHIITGFSVALVDSKGTLYKHGFGFSNRATGKGYTDTTIQNIASISKTFIGIGLLKAQELGLLKLDDPIDQYLPFKVFNPKFPDSKITIRQLATHTSSIQDNIFYITKDYIIYPDSNNDTKKVVFDGGLTFNPPDTYLPLQTLLENMLTQKGKWFTKDTYSSNQPGEKFAYSNIGATLAAYIIERASGQGFDVFTKKYILDPLGMIASGWHPETVNTAHYSRLYHETSFALPAYTMSSYPDGNFITSATDLSKYLRELINGYNGKGSILSQKSYAEYFTGHLNNQNFTERDTTDPFSDEYNMSVFLGISPKGYFGHTGSDPGVNTIMFFDPKKSIGALLITNTSFDPARGDSVFNTIWSEIWKYKDSYKK